IERAACPGEPRNRTTRMVAKSWRRIFLQLSTSLPRNQLAAREFVCRDVTIRGSAMIIAFSRTGTATAAPQPAAETGSSSSSSDESLIARIADGDQLAMRWLFARHRLPLYRWLRRLVGDEALADDLLSEVFLDVWRQAGSFEGRSSVSSWLLAIARHKALSAHRRRAHESLDESLAAAIADPADDPETLLQ